MSFDPGCLQSLLPTYYRRLFPCRLLSSWLRYGSNDYFQKREFSFILPDDVYLRYRSYADPLEFERDLFKTAPEKIDIGAVYNYRPKEDRRKKDLCAVERELVFDIDMTDYDDVRTCCKGAGVCKKCWLFMVVAIRIVDQVLDADFGFDERLWVFSGRRGVHCWISDEIARKLSTNARSAIVEYLTVSSGGERTKTVELKGRHLHTSIRRACSILEKYFPKLVAQQGWLDSDDDIEKMLSLINDQELRNTIEGNMKSCETGVQRWQSLVRTRKEITVPINSAFFIEEIMLQYAYPRLDANVTKGINHLLKSPFCVHAKTGKVCIPLDITSEASLLDFDPDNVPRIDQLHDELIMINKDASATDVIENENSNRKAVDYKKTSLKAHVEFFEEYVKRIKQINCEKAVSMEF